MRKPSRAEPYLSNDQVTDQISEVEQTALADSLTQRVPLLVVAHRVNDPS